eukprot:CAMPEP_0196582966 /NCGR_PEP_ID=MMETSP1081-20130531/41466_1 /TAXON_ID=36882 /ORGANISM="Pyramimonas amylifera, Strain CCMP720" /LENGTH=56 /DNA_ID=CAMNT_0041903703 /DNA_START=36 /DNA_END=203 /DNA_ORIENTATION=-
MKEYQDVHATAKILGQKSVAELRARIDEVKTVKARELRQGFRAGKFSLTGSKLVDN